jgi:glycosyltransferase involved in cell wall biosynthesis
VPNAPAAAEPEAFDRAEAREELAPGASRIVVCVARLQPEKGIAELLEATASLVEGVPGLAVVVAGAGPEHERLAAQVADRGLAGTFLLLGHRSDVGRVLASADAFCLPSHREGLPLSLLEAMRGGLPCVATAVGGIPGLVQDGVSGLLVEPNDPVALAAALERVLSDDGFARSLGAAARERVESHHSPRAVARSYADLYGELAAR